MNNLRFLICLLAILISSITNGQTVSGIISGTVSNAPGPIDVIVSIGYGYPSPKGFTDTVTTNSAGNFSTSYTNVSKWTFYRAYITYIGCGSYMYLDSTAVNDTSVAGRNPVFTLDYCPPCIANFNINPNGTTGFNFYNTSTPPTPTLQFHWDFGDSTYSTSQHVNHTYNWNGWFNVCLTITDTVTSCSNQFCDSVYVGGVSCLADFQVSTVSQFVRNFTNLSSPSHSGVTYLWDFGDLNTSTAKNPTHTYSTGGTYAVCLDVYDTLGNCSNQYCDSVVINPPCQADFNEVYVNPNTKRFYANPTPNHSAISYTWDFGDMSSSSTLKNPIHSYSLPGIYNVCLTMFDSINFCTDQYCDTIQILNFCSAQFGYTKNNLSLSFNNQSTAGKQYLWKFGDGNTSTAFNPMHTFLNPGSYNICLLVADSASSFAAPCDSICYNVTVIDSTFKADFSWTTNGPTVTFSNQSLGNIGRYRWMFGDGDTSNAVNPVHTYVNQSNYNVCLSIFDAATNAFRDAKCQWVNISFPTPKNLFGTITANNTSPGDGIVYLIKHDTLTNQLSAVDSILIGSSFGNTYSFSIMSHGTYYVKAALLPSNSNYWSYLPTYYNNSLLWSSASAITMSGVNVGQVNINLIQGVNPGGPAFIGGNVSLGANKVAGPGDPYKDAVVILTDDLGNAIGYDVTDENGKYEFKNLAYGTYKLNIDILNKNSATRTIVLNATNEREENVNFQVGEKEISTGINTLYNVALEGFYPNPARDIIQVTLDVQKANQAQLMITDITGKPVLEESMNLPAGNQTIALNIEHLTSGVYMMSIITNTEVISQRIVKQ